MYDMGAIKVQAIDLSIEMREVYLKFSCSTGSIKQN